MSDEEEQDSEMCALQAILGQDVCINREEKLVTVSFLRILRPKHIFLVPDVQRRSPFLHSKCLQAFIPAASHVPRVELRAHMPPSYPSSSPPIIDLSAGPQCPPELVSEAADHLQELFHPGVHTHTCMDRHV